MALLLQQDDGRVGEDSGVAGVPRERDLEVVRGAIGVAHALEQQAEIAMHPDAIGPQRERQVVPFPGEREELPVIEGGAEVALADGASGIGFHRVVPESLRVLPYLYLIP